MTKRRSYPESCQYLQGLGLLREGPPPPLPTRSPRYDDEILGVDLFRWAVVDASLEELTLPRTYVARTELRNCSLNHSDLTGSVVNWTDLIDVTFTGTILSSVDFRACTLVRVSFTEADLSNADLRCCSFEDCTFENAKLNGTLVRKGALREALFSSEQNFAISWQDEDGAMPEGG